MDNFQSLFNATMGLLLAVGGWWANTIWNAIKDLQATDANILRELEESNKEVIAEVSKVEQLVTSQYITRKESADNNDKVLAKLEKLDELKVLLAGTYINKSTFDTHMAEHRTEMLNRFDRLEVKLDTKADKPR